MVPVLTKKLEERKMAMMICQWGNNPAMVESQLQEFISLSLKTDINFGLVGKIMASTKRQQHGHYSMEISQKLYQLFVIVKVNILSR